MAHVSVYRIGEQVVLTPYHGTVDGFYVAGTPTHSALLPIEPSVFGAEVRKAIAACQVEVATPTASEPVAAPLLRQAGLRSWSALQRRAECVNVELLGDSVVVTPTRNGGTRGDSKGYHSLPSTSATLPRCATDRDLGLEVLDAFRRCLPRGAG